MPHVPVDTPLGRIAGHCTHPILLVIGTFFTQHQWCCDEFPPFPSSYSRLRTCEPFFSTRAANNTMHSSIFNPSVQAESKLPFQAGSRRSPLAKLRTSIGQVLSGRIPYSSRGHDLLFRRCRFADAVGCYPR